MNHRILKGLAGTAVLAMALAACSSSGSTASSSSSTGTSSSATGKPLVIDDTPISPMTDTFNPYSSTSTGYVVGAEALYNEPLMIWNTLNPNQAPFHVLATGYSWSDGGKTLTLTTRSGVKWSDGKPFSASDVAFTFNMIRTVPGLQTDGTPVPVSATAPNATTAVLKFSQPEYANLFLIGQTYIVPQHIWSSVKPATFADPSPVGTGPYVVDKFTPQGFTLKANPDYWNKANVHVPEVDYPSYNANFNIVNPLATGQIDYAGNDIANVQNVYLAKSPDNHTWFPKAPYLNANNVVSLIFNVTKAPLNDPAVREAISYAINRQQLSSQGETGYELPETSSSGLLLPSAKTYLEPSLANNLPAGGDPAKVTSILKADGWTKTGGKWTKNGKTISFSIADPIPYSDYYLDAQDIAKQLNAQGIEATVDGIGNPTVWDGDVTNGTFDAAIHWSNQGPTPYQIYDNWLDHTLSAPVGKAAAGDLGRYDSPAAQAALSEYAGSGSSSGQHAAITKLENIINTQVPVAPLLSGADWYEYSTKDYVGWESASNPFMNPTPGSPYLEETVLHLKPAS
ncbi:MAG: ABC transporter substrate-binding protein [Streptosporangiaceae bacterium]|jgi:peptide/nickel transport system substrate-binding protein